MNNFKKRPLRQIAALVCAVILILIYIISLIAAFLDFPGWEKMFAACLLLSICLPILLWLYMWMFDMLKNRYNSSASSLPDGGPHTDAETDNDDSGTRDSIMK